MFFATSDHEIEKNGLAFFGNSTDRIVLAEGIPEEATLSASRFFRIDSGLLTNSESRMRKPVKNITQTPEKPFEHFPANYRIPQTYSKSLPSMGLAIFEGGWAFLPFTRPRSVQRSGRGTHGLPLQTVGGPRPSGPPEKIAPGIFAGERRLPPPGGTGAVPRRSAA